MKIIISLVILNLLLGCTKKDAGTEPKSSESAKTEVQEKSDVKWMASSDLERLGAHLYFDKRLSADNTVSCNSCHDVTGRKGGVDGLPVSVGIGNQKGGRNAPTVWNAKFLSVQFWDGRAKDLAEQAKGPITNPIEMGMKDHDVVIEKIKKVEGYQKMFKRVFPEDDDPVNIGNLATAIAAFESTLTTLDSPFDKFKAGDKSALSPMAQKGHELFQQVGCVSCHSGAHFAGPDLPVGTGFFMKFPTFPDEEIEKKYGFTEDKGRFEVTKKEEDKNMWRVPTLRNVAITGPYFHTGNVEDLEEAVRIMAKLQLNKELEKDQVEAIVAFLESLTGELPEITEPEQIQ